MPPIGVSAIGSECGHLSYQVSRFIPLRFARASRICTAASGHQHYAKVRSHGEGARKQPQNHIRRGAGRNVVILGLAPQQQVAHASAGQISLIPGGAQGCDDLESRVEFVRGG